MNKTGQISLLLRNGGSKSIDLLIEPSGLAFEMLPGSSYQVYWQQDGEIPEIEHKERLIILHLYSCVVYQGTHKIYDLSDN